MILQPQHPKHPQKANHLVACLMKDLRATSDLRKRLQARIGSWNKMSCNGIPSSHALDSRPGPGQFLNS